MDPFSLVSMQHLSSNALAKGTADLEFVAKFGEPWGNPRKYKSHTSPGRKFALLEGLSHDLKSVPDRFIMSILRGRCTGKGTADLEFVANGATQENTKVIPVLIN